MTNRVLIGQRGDGSYGLDISLAGQDVTTGNIDSFVFSTLAGSAGSIHASGTLTRGSSVGYTDLGYTPIALMSFLDSSGNQVGQYTSNGPLSGGYQTYYVEPFFSITSNTITSIALDPSGSYPYSTCQYVILRFPGS